MKQEKRVMLVEMDGFVQAIYDCPAEKVWLL